jgi:hypothetical protein
MTFPIVVTYTSLDRCYLRRSFKTLDGAKKFAHERVGPHPTTSQAFGYAVSDDGIGKVTVSGATMEEVFPPPAERRTEEEFDDRDL